jgi:broad specificity phosphatase PhoE
MPRTFLPGPLKGGLVIISLAHQAFQRFNAAGEKFVADAPHGNLALVTHGTVLTLFVAFHNPQIDALAFWRSLQLPDLIVLTLPDFRLANR